MKRGISVVFTLALLCALLGGCMHETLRAEVHADGSGVVSVRAGYTREFLEQLIAEAEDPAAARRLAELPSFEADGRVYYGVTDAASFAAPGEFAEALARLSAEANDAVGGGGLSDAIRLMWDGNGLTLLVDNRAPDAPDAVYEADEAETARRVAALAAVYRDRAPGVPADRRDALVRQQVDERKGFTPEEFDAFLDELRRRSAAEFDAILREELDYLDWAGLTDELRATREAETARVLLASPLPFDEEDARACAAYFVDFYDDPPAAFDRRLAELAG